MSKIDRKLTNSFKEEITNNIPFKLRSAMNEINHRDQVASENEVKTFKASRKNGIPRSFWVATNNSFKNIKKCLVKARKI